MFVVLERVPPNHSALYHPRCPASLGPDSKPVCFLRLVNTCLAEELKEIHAFEQKTLTPEQWEKQKAQ